MTLRLDQLEISLRLKRVKLACIYVVPQCRDLHTLVTSDQAWSLMFYVDTLNSINTK